MRSTASGRRIWAARDLSREVSHAEALRAALALASVPGWHWRVSGEQATFALVAALEAAAAAGQVVISAGGERWSCRGRVTRSALQIGASREGDWLGLAGFAEIDGERVELALLLEAVRRGDRHVRTGDRTFVAPDEVLLVDLAPLADLVFETDRGLFASVAAATALASLCPNGARDVEGERSPRASAAHRGRSARRALARGLALRRSCARSSSSSSP